MREGESVREREGVREGVRALGSEILEVREGERWSKRARERGSERRER